MYPKPIFWYSGQFLEPQHFQETDAWNQRERAEILRLCRPFFEGVARLSVNPAALSGGVLEFDAAELVFRDGSHVLWAGGREDGNASPIRRALPSPDEWGGETLVVHGRLDCLRERRNVAGLDKAEDVKTEHYERYDAWVAPQETPDRYVQPHVTLPKDACPVTRIVYNVRLVWENEAGDGEGGIRMPLLRLKRDGAKIAVDDAFIPPLAVVGGSERLMGRLREFMRVLGDFPRRAADASGDGPPSLAELLTRQAAARLLSDLDSMLRWEMASPWETFRLLRSACAEFASAAEMNAMAAETAIPHYDHYGLTLCFPDLIGECEGLLSRFLPEVVATLEPEYSDGILLFRLSGAAMAAGNVFRLSVKTGEPLRDILAEGRIIAGSPDAVRKAVRLALPELPLAVVPAPRGLPVVDGLGYLAPNQRHAAWSAVMDARCLALAYYPAAAPGAERLRSMVRLHVLRGGRT